MEVSVRTARHTLGCNGWLGASGKPSLPPSSHRSVAKGLRCTRLAEPHGGRTASSRQRPECRMDDSPFQSCACISSAAT